MSVGGNGRAGVYKQDAAGIAIGTGHLEYELTDHLGNVRVTFKKGTGSTLQVLSKNDYYAFGGTLPGRVWQQSGGDYRFGYQGQEKSQMEVNWDEFELRQYNHDLGRWSAPDPFGQQASPYVAMGNNPVIMIDPNGGYYNMSSSGQAQAKRWFTNLAEDRAHHRGRFSFENLYANYTDALDELWQQHYGNRLTRDNNDYKYLEDLYKLNNEFMGLGLDGDVLSSGRDIATATTLESDYGKDLMWDLTSQNDSRQKAQDKANAAYALKDPGTSNFDNVEGAWINACNQRQRNFVNKWRAKRERKAAVKKTQRELHRGSKNHNAVGGSQNTVVDGLKQGIIEGKGGYGSRSDLKFVMDIIGPAGQNSLISSTAVKGASDAEIDITHIALLGPDVGTGAEYSINFKDSNGESIFTFNRTVSSTGTVSDHLMPIFPIGDNGPQYDLNGGTIEISVKLSDRNIGTWGERYDQCWNVNFGYTLTTYYND